jgi:hypothetical protein
VWIRCADHMTPLYPQKLALTSPTGGGRSVGIVHLRTKATEFVNIHLCMSLTIGTNTKTERRKKRLPADVQTSKASRCGSVTFHTEPANTHMEATLLLWLLNPADCLLNLLLIFSGEYGLLGSGGALSHLRCSRSAIVPKTCRYRHQLDTYYWKYM